ncbi:GNAT family N-acetyltransferase [Flavobacterium sp. K5-23]|uniref:GNAT family N-acetyltransferase n=1 Tax=Flavobacterium sp. K5-23 TaxID=2746225 RepID=UPI00200C52AB|nr:GNAT family protein [Flavobacterium sp. K5-23]UQD56764.1 GNAT family N-acetyltransferase [Flavobacterium sp. K5-23]
MNFNYSENYILENEAVLLRPLEKSDFEYLLEYSLNEPDIWTYNANGANGAENLERYISNTITQRENEKEYPFIVFDKKTGKFVGSTRFYDIQPGNNTLQLGFTWYGKKSQGTGINKNCKMLLLEFAFENMAVERVGFKANNQNLKSINAMKSIGCVEEGVNRSYSTNSLGERIDAISLSIIKTEWFESVKQNLKNKIDSY